MLGHVPTRTNSLIAHYTEHAANRALEAIQVRTDDLAKRLPGQREYLQHMYKKAGVEFEG
jgi:hypothetical protein